MNELENAKQNLREEFQRMPHSRHDLLGNAACGRKIKNLIIAYILENVSQNTCVENIQRIMLEEGVIKEDFEKEIVSYIDAYYKAKELIDRGYCKDLLIKLSTKV
jgi:methyl coenzyme M reductase beta subunit